MMQVNCFGQLVKLRLWTRTSWSGLVQEAAVREGQRLGVDVRETTLLV